MKLSRLTRHNRWWRLLAWALVAAVLLPAVAHADPGDPLLQPSQNTGDWLNPDTEIGKKIAQLYDYVYYIAIGVFVIVEGALLFAVIKYRFRPGREGAVVPQVHGNTALEITWTAIPALIVAGLFVLTFNLMNEIHAGPNGDGSYTSSLNPQHVVAHNAIPSLTGQAPAGALKVEAIGHQWWWEFRYPELGITTANVMHVPPGRAIEVYTSSKDVIHAWWVPQMTGKQDAVPGVVNVTWFRTNLVDAGKKLEYYGHCTEFCGDEHGMMRFLLQVDSDTGFDAWAAQQIKIAAPAATPQLKEGESLFVSKGCYGCHAIAGHPNKDAATDTGNKIGPNLTHFAGRQILAGGALTNTSANVSAWLRNPGAIKPGNRMSSAVKPGTLTPAQIEALTAYLVSLK